MMPVAQASPSPAIEPMLSRQQIAAWLGITTRKLDSLRSSGRFPKPDLAVGSSLRWKRSTVQAWIDAGGDRQP